jgi:hypothetical protein
MASLFAVGLNSGVADTSSKALLCSERHAASHDGPGCCGRRRGLFDLLRGIDEGCDSWIIVKSPSPNDELCCRLPSPEPAFERGVCNDRVCTLYGSAALRYCPYVGAVMAEKLADGLSCRVR